MRTRRGNLLTFAFVFLWFGCFASACGGVDPGPADGAGGGGDMVQSMSDMGKLPFAAMCTDNSQCQSGLCTKNSYDMLPGPICTYTCTPGMTDPNCPYGCNPKGYCRPHA